MTMIVVYGYDSKADVELRVGQGYLDEIGMDWRADIGEQRMDELAAAAEKLVVIQEEEDIWELLADEIATRE